MSIFHLTSLMLSSALLAQGDIVSVEDLALGPARPSGAPHFEGMTLEEIERHAIERALGRTSGNVTEAATLLGVSRSALYRRLQHYGLKGSG